MFQKLLFRNSNNKTFKFGWQVSRKLFFLTHFLSGHSCTTGVFHFWCFCPSSLKIEDVFSWAGSGGQGRTKNDGTPLVYEGRGPVFIPLTLILYIFEFQMFNWPKKIFFFCRRWSLRGRGKSVRRSTLRPERGKVRTPKLRGRRAPSRRRTPTSECPTSSPCFPSFNKPRINY